MKELDSKNKRNSSIEFFKIFGIFLIIIAHLTQTLMGTNNLINTSDIINVGSSSTSINNIILNLFFYLGTIGNFMFLIPSCYFLSDKNETKIKKVLYIVVDVWIVSVLFLITFLLFNVDIAKGDILKSFFPISFANNWYITCYLLLFILSPYINKIINNSNKEELKKILLLLIIVYFGICFVKSDMFFCNNLIMFIVIYIIVGSIKKLEIKFSEKKVFLFSTLICIIGFLALNYLGLKISFLSDKMLHFAKLNNIFIFTAVLSLFYLIKNNNWYSKTIYYIASLSLLIYIIHENLLFRKYFRYLYFHFVNTSFGYDHIVIWILLYGIIIFILAIVLSSVYELTIKKIVKKTLNKINI